jgi:F-type H+-transporting ATPase subunit c
MKIYITVLALVTGFGLSIGIIFASRVQWKAIATAVESIQRQPETASRVQLSLIIGLALIEALVIYLLLASFLLLGKLLNY